MIKHSFACYFISKGVSSNQLKLRVLMSGVGRILLGVSNRTEFQLNTIKLNRAQSFD